MDYPEDAGFDEDEQDFSKQNKNSKNINQDSLVDMERQLDDIMKTEKETTIQQKLTTSQQISSKELKDSEVSPRQEKQIMTANVKEGNYNSQLNLDTSEIRVIEEKKLMRYEHPEIIQKTQVAAFDSQPDSTRSKTKIVGQASKVIPSKQVVKKQQERNKNFN